MNQHVMRPDQSERTEYGLTLTDAQPLSGIPALWRFAALVATLLMGVLALIAALHFGRSILLPVVAALIVGITLAPVVKFGSRLSIPQPVSALLVVVLVAVLVGSLLTFFAAPLTEWIARAPEIGKVVQEKLRVLDYPLTVLRDIRGAVMPAASHGPTVALEIQSGRNGRRRARRDHAGGQPVRAVLRHAGVLPRHQCDAAAEADHLFRHAQRTAAHDPDLERHRAQPGELCRAGAR